jgi:hypothetical protein
VATRILPARVDLPNLLRVLAKLASARAAGKRPSLNFSCLRFDEIREDSYLALNRSTIFGAVLAKGFSKELFLNHDPFHGAHGKIAKTNG